MSAQRLFIKIHMALGIQYRALRERALYVGSFLKDPHDHAEIFARMHCDKGRVTASREMFNRALAARSSLGLEYFVNVKVKHRGSSVVITEISLCDAHKNIRIPLCS